MTVEEMEKLLRDEAQAQAEKEPLSRLMLGEQVLNRKDFADMLGVTLACQLAGEVIDRAELEKMFRDIYQKNPDILLCAAKDLKAAVLRGAACTSHLEPLLFFRGLLMFRCMPSVKKEAEVLSAPVYGSIHVTRITPARLSCGGALAWHAFLLWIYSGRF